jgi:beta-phosphoglucomutase-like phosphatase (HAD superfamily)
MPGFLPSWISVAAELDMNMTSDVFYACAGLPLADVVRRVFSFNDREPPSDTVIHDFLVRKRAVREVSEATAGHPPGIECVIDIARRVKAAGLPIACATSGLRDVVELHMKHAGIAELFDVVVCVGDLPPGRGKPEPDVYVEAARQIGVSG